MNKRKFENNSKATIYKDKLQAINKANIIYATIIILFIAILGCLYLVNKQHDDLLQKMATQQATYIDLSSKIADNYVHIKSLIAITNTLENKYNKQKDSCELNNKTINKVKNDLFAIQGNDRTQWLVFEAESLVNFAKQQMQFSNNKQQTISVLQMANDILQNAQQQIVVVLQEEITSIINKLQQCNHIDYAIIQAKLDLIADKVKCLPVVINVKQNDISSPQQIYSQEQKNTSFSDIIMQKLTYIWLSISKLFIITKQEKINTSPLLSEQELYAIKLIIYSSIEQAKIAAFVKQPKIFIESINNAIKYIQFIIKNQNHELFIELNMMLDAMDNQDSYDDILQPLLTTFSRVNSEILSNKQDKNNIDNSQVNTEENKQ